MKLYGISAMARTILALMLLLAVTLPASAQVTIFSPFNIKEAMDAGVRKHANLPYADGERKKLDVYRPEDTSGGPAPVVMFIYGGAWRGFSSGVPGTRAASQ